MHKEALSFKLYEICDMNDEARGVYAFWYEVTGRCLYVGKAQRQSIHSRLRQHWGKERNPELALWMKNFGNKITFCYFSVENVAHIDRLEKRLIHLLNPETNKQHKKR